jgi:puromycin-sensitive aminopeptidase
VASALSLSHRLTTEADQPALQAAVAALVGPQFAHLGFDPVAGEGERTPTLRSLVIHALGVIGQDESVRTEAARRFDASPLGGGNEPIAADVESATLAVVAQLVRPGDYDALLARYRAADTPQEELRSLQALTLFPDVGLAERTFDLALTEVRSQNGFIVITSLLANPVAGQSIWRKMTESWDRMLERFPKNAHTRMIEAIPTLCADAEFAAGVVTFLNDHPLASGPRRVAQSIERLGVNVAFAARERDRLGAALRAAAAATG